MGRGAAAQAGRHGSPPIDIKSPWFAAAAFALGLAVAAWLIGGGDPTPATIDPSPSPTPIDGGGSTNSGPAIPVAVGPEAKREVRARMEEHRRTFEPGWDALVRCGAELESRRFASAEERWVALQDHVARQVTVGNAHLFLLGQLAPRVGADFNERLGDFSAKKPAQREATERSWREWRQFATDLRAMADSVYRELHQKTAP